MEQIREYKIINKIGEGGMGEVYLAEDENLGRQVAIKMLAPELMRNAELVERFKQEARLQASLIHPNIVALHTFFTHENMLYMVMEYAQGITLKELIKQKGKLEENTAKHIILQILEGVGYAHQLGIVHRDLKPSNIMVNKNGNIKIMDFGIAKVLGDRGMTKTGTKMGTLYYMSPEQVKAEKDIDQRTDIYSLGIIFYEMLTGKVPFNTDTESDFEVMREIVDGNTATRIRNLNTLSSNVKNIISKMTINQKSNRYVTCYNCSEEIKGNGTVKFEIKEEPKIINNSYKAEIDPIIPVMIEVKGGAYVRLSFGLFGSVRRDGTINVIKDFRISKYPITQKEWKSIMYRNDSIQKNDSYPITNISIADIKEYINKLNEFTGKKFTIPSREVWEYAACGGHKFKEFKFAGSNKIEDVGWFEENSNHMIKPVGQKQSNSLGIYDMSGNVFEVTSTICEGDDNSFIVKGGAYNSNIESCKINTDRYIKNTDKKNNLGLRLIEII